MRWLLKTNPKLVPTLVTVPALILVAFLGGWQVQRLIWKEALIAEIDASLSSPPKPLAEVLESLQTQSPRHLFAHVELEGTFQHALERHMAARYYKGTLGYHLYTPFVWGDDQWIMANRGWVPKEQKNAESRPDTQPDERLKLRAILREASGKGLFSPENDPEDNMWFWEELSSMQADWPEGKAVPYILEILAVEPAEDGVELKTSLPILATARLTLRNDHLSYAITWFSMFIAILVIYIIYHRNYSADS